MGSKRTHPVVKAVAVLVIAWVVLGVLSTHPVLLAPLLLIVFPVGLLLAAVTGSVGLWRLVWHGGRRQRDLVRSEQERRVP